MPEFLITDKALVLYKNRPALVSGKEDGKLIITLLDKSTQKVREKDIELLHPGPCNQADLTADPMTGDIHSAWELLEGSDKSQSAEDSMSIKELSELIYETYTPATALSVWKLLEENTYFYGNIHEIKIRSKTELEKEEKKRKEKHDEAEERIASLSRIKKILESRGKLVIEDSDKRFLSDVEALARGHTDKSRTLKELGWSETPQEAHRLLLACGAWTKWENPHPGRFGLSLNTIKTKTLLPTENQSESNSSQQDHSEPDHSEPPRLDLTHIPAYAIDNSWSDDPDDAISLEDPDSNGKRILWVHVSDPASIIRPDSPADLEARNKGATLYLPEGKSLMLSPELLPLFALGYKNKDISPSLSIKITLNPDLSIEETQFILSNIKVIRLSYKQADSILNAENKDLHAENLGKLMDIADQYTEKRLDGAAVIIDFPETHITADLTENPQVSIESIPQYRSANLVRECMVLAGEAASRWAVRNRVPFPFISQEAGELPQKRLQGLAGAFQLRRSMRPRSLSTKPGVHWGLGLDMYTQITSPLRRYTDLLAHQQIRAFLKGEKLLSEEEILVRVVTAERGASQTIKAERASKAHWICVYLADKIGTVWEGIILDNQGNRAVVFIPELGIETQISLKSGNPNEKITLSCLQVKIHEGEAVFGNN